MRRTGPRPASEQTDADIGHHGTDILRSSVIARSAGPVKLTGAVDYEKQAMIGFTVRGSDAGGNSTLKTFTLDALGVYEPASAAALHDIALM